jgi:hypothetical protein
MALPLPSLNVATSSGASQDFGSAFSNTFGDQVIGKKPLPPWVWLAAIAGVVIIALAWLKRR